MVLFFRTSWGAVLRFSQGKWMVRHAYVNGALMKSVDIIYHILEGGTVGRVTYTGPSSVQSGARNSPKGNSPSVKV